MVQDYATRYYLPCSKRYNALSREGFSGLKDLAVWRQKVMTGWNNVLIEGVTTEGKSDMYVGEDLKIKTSVRLGSLNPEDVTVEAYYGMLGKDGDFAERETVPLELVESNDGLYSFSGLIPCRETGRFGYTIRVTPSQKKLENPYVLGLVTWA
jgi:starch phosphorylase